MGRPSTITAATAEAIRRARAGGAGIDRVRAKLAAEGHAITRSTLARHMRSAGKDAPSPTSESAPAVAAVVSAAGEAVATGRLENLTRAQNYLAVALDEHGPKLGRDRKSVLSFSAIVKASAEVARAIDDASPRPPAERYAPVEGEALAALLARARAVSAPGDELVELRATVALLRGALAAEPDDEEP